MDHEQAVAVRGADTDGLPASDREVVRPGERAPAQLVDVEVDVAQLQEGAAELVLAALRVLLDEPLLLQRPQQAVDRALGESQPLAELRDSQAPRSPRQSPQDRRRAFD